MAGGRVLIPKNALGCRNPAGFRVRGLGFDLPVLCPRNRTEVASGPSKLGVNEWQPARLSSRLRLVLRRVFRNDAKCSRVSQKTGRGKPRPYGMTVFKDKHTPPLRQDGFQGQASPAPTTGRFSRASKPRPYDGGTRGVAHGELDAVQGGSKPQRVCFPAKRLRSFPVALAMREKPGGASPAPTMGRFSRASKPRPYRGGTRGVA